MIGESSEKDLGEEFLSNAMLELGLAVLEFQKITNSILPPEEGLKENWQYATEDINDLKLGISIMEEHLDQSRKMVNAFSNVKPPRNENSSFQN